MEVKFTSKSKGALRLNFFFQFRIIILTVYATYFTEFPSERQTKDQDGALILICLPVLRKIRSWVLVFAGHCNSLFEWSDSWSCRLLMSDIYLMQFCRDHGSSFFPWGMALYLAYVTGFSWFNAPFLDSSSSSLFSSTVICQTFYVVVFALEWSGPWMGSRLPPQKMCGCE